jgi:heat shock protein HtpX
LNIYQQQSLNRRRTIFVMVTFVGFLLFLGLGFDYAYFSAGASIPVPVGTSAALLYGSGSAAYSYFRGDRAVLASAAAVSVPDVLAMTAAADTALQVRQFQNVVEEMAIAAGLPVPKAYVVPDPDPNAFATGRDPAHASIAVTQGLLRLLTREQLQGVVAHEMAHIRNYDVRLMTVVAALVGAIALISDWSTRALRHGGTGGARRSSSRDKKGGGNALLVVVLVLWIVAIVLAPIVSHLLATMVSRRREYLADATGAELTRNPLALADALAKIEGEAAATKSIKQGSAHLCIADPLERRVNEKEGRFADLFATHPPMHKRIEALRAMAYQGTTASGQ